MNRTICVLSSVLFTALFCNASNLGLKTVVIDPGHGGHDPGCVSRDKKTYEKNIALDISLKLASRIRESCPDVKVLMTRDKDNYVTLNDRAEYANRANADLFISIHINSVPSASPSGCSVHVLGQSGDKSRDLFASNMSICRRENSVILMEDDYTTKYQGFNPEDPESFIFLQLMQNSYLERSLEFAQICSLHLKSGPIKLSKGIWQDPFYVLWKTSMPAALVELGFLSNVSDLEVLRSDASRTDLAAALFNAFIEFKEGYDQSLDINPNEKKNGSTEQIDKGKVVKSVDTGASTVAVELEETASAGTYKKNTATDSDAGSNHEMPVTTVSNALSKEVAEKPGPDVSPVVTYGIQVFCLKSRIADDDPRFLGHKTTVISREGIFKYVIGTSTDEKKVRAMLPEIRKKYPQAFIVTL